MLKRIFRNEATAPHTVPREGDLYKTVTVGEVTFELRYGYYAEIDRKSEPDVIYPDLVRVPVYTEEGRPLATMMQDPCESFKGKKTEDTCCGDCSYFQRCEDLIGICVCDSNRKRE